MDTPITESEADTLFTQTRSDGTTVAQPGVHDSFLQFVRLISTVALPTGQAVLVCRLSPDAPALAWIIGEKLTLGKMPDCTISAPEVKTLSRLHFTIVRTPEGCMITDHSSNGTFLYPGTIRLPREEPYLLKDGDILWVEGLVLAFKDATE